ncbi:MAG: hypothetical protein OXN97_06615 [Bryobacterales bacterium]|nr:hypothetical protein [Bryobacterales bacterium]
MTEERSETAAVVRRCAAFAVDAVLLAGMTARLVLDLLERI